MSQGKDLKFKSIAKANLQMVTRLNKVYFAIFFALLISFTFNICLIRTHHVPL